MPEKFSVYTSGEVVMGQKQAKCFALSIYGGVKAYIQTHSAEFQEWLERGVSE